MAIQTTPHTESQQNQGISESDLEPGLTEQTVGTGDDAALYANAEGAQTGTGRNPNNTAQANGHGALPPSNTLEGSLTSRTPASGQGITSRPAAEENAGQEKVVADRPDAQSAVNQS